MKNKYEMVTKTFEVKLPKYICENLTKVSKHTRLTENDLVGNSILALLMKYNLITHVNFRFNIKSIKRERKNGSKKISKN